MLNDVLQTTTSRIKVKFPVISSWTGIVLLARIEKTCCTFVPWCFVKNMFYLYRLDSKGKESEQERTLEGSERLKNK